MGHRVRDIARRLASARQVHAIGIAVDRAQLGMGFQEKAVLVTRHVQPLRQLSGARRRYHRRRQHDHVHRQRHRASQVGVLGAHDQAIAIRHHLCAAPTNHDHALVLDPLVELFVALAKGAHVHVELKDLGMRLFLDQVGQLERVHAADARAVRLIVLVAAAHAVHDRHALGFFAAAHDDIAARRP